jgi:hypothetical protein
LFRSEKPVFLVKAGFSLMPFDAFQYSWAKTMPPSAFPEQPSAFPEQPSAFPEQPSAFP